MYRALRLHSPSRDGSSDTEKFYQVPETRAHGSFLRKNVSWLLLLLSLVFNLGLVVVATTSKDNSQCVESSNFGWWFPAAASEPEFQKSILTIWLLAGLKRTIPKAWTPNSGTNDTEQDVLWDETSYDRGQIALSDDYARDMGLPRAQRFPWDQTKGIYLINAYHNIHCVVSPLTNRTTRRSLESHEESRKPFEHQW